MSIAEDLELSLVVNYSEFQDELEAWSSVNRQLKQHGLKHVLLSDPHQMLQSDGTRTQIDSIIVDFPFRRYKSVSFFPPTLLPPVDEMESFNFDLFGQSSFNHSSLCIDCIGIVYCIDSGTYDYIMSLPIFDLWYTQM